MARLLNLFFGFSFPEPYTKLLPNISRTIFSTNGLDLVLLGRWVILS